MYIIKGRYKYFVLFVFLCKILELNPVKIPPIDKNNTPFFPIVSKNKNKIAIVLSICLTSFLVN